MLINKDSQLLQEAYISATQKTVNVPPRVVAKQPDDTEETETYEDRMQQSGEVNSDVDTISTNNSAEEDNTQENSFNNTVSGILMISAPADQNDCEQEKMDRTNLYSLYTSVRKIYDIVSAGHKLDPWMRQKIAICTDGLCNVQKVVEYDYQSSQNSSINPSDSK